MSANWLVGIKRCERPGLRLICFPFGGAGATAFWTWQPALPPDAELWAVALPGREHRSDERAVSEAGVVVEALCAELGGLGEVPYVFYGHSLGAGLALQTASLLRARGRPLPSCLIASGRLPPHYPCERWAQQPDEQLLGHLTVLGGIPPALLTNRSFLATYLPRIRADFGLNESLAYQRVPAFDFPITIINGRDDPLVDPAVLGEWHEYTTRRFSAVWLAGDHFFMQSNPGPFFDALGQELAQARDAA